MDSPQNSENVSKYQVGYQQAIALVGIVSQEIYSRFNSMLTANSIIIAIIGLAITTNKLPPTLVIILPSAGLVFCILWFLLIRHGYYYQRSFRNEAEKLEREYFNDTFKLFNNDHPSPPLSTYPISIMIICVFGFVYIVILLYLLCKICKGV